RARGVGGGAQAAVAHLFGDQLFEPVLAQRRLAGIDLGDLVLVDVHADHRMTIPGQAGAGHATDVAEAEYRNIAHDFWDSLLERKKRVLRPRCGLRRARSRPGRSIRTGGRWS